MNEAVKIAPAMSRCRFSRSYFAGQSAGAVGDASRSRSRWRRTVIFTKANTLKRLRQEADDFEAEFWSKWRVKRSIPAMQRKWRRAGWDDQRSL